MYTPVDKIKYIVIKRLFFELKVSQSKVAIDLCFNYKELIVYENVCSRPLTMPKILIFITAKLCLRCCWPYGPAMLVSVNSNQKKFLQGGGQAGFC